MKLKASSVVMVVGRRGEGKSYWMNRHIVQDADRCIIWTPYAKGRNPDYPGVERVDLEELIAMPEMIAQRERYKIVINVDWNVVGEFAEDFGPAIEAVREIAEQDAERHEKSKRIPFVLVIDECGVLLTPTPGKVPSWVWLETAATQSRHWGYGVPLVLGAQRAPQIRPNARNQANTVVSFFQPRGPDTKALIDTCGDEAECVAELDMYEPWIWTRQRKQKTKKEKEDGKD